VWGEKKGDEKAFSGTALTVRCYEKHPAIKIGKGKLYGGSASHPVMEDADIYVALQSGSTSGLSSDPWEKDKVVEIHYSITDMHAPKDVDRFKKLVTWLCTQLQNGQTVHVGCIGGHGRSGLLISSIVAEALEKKDAIQWVRKHYCKKAVESKAQIQFLMKHYGVTEADPTKESYTKPNGHGTNYTSWGSKSFQSIEKFMTSGHQPESWVSETKGKQIVPEGVSASTRSFVPAASSRNLWKVRKRKI
jgi:hypothetical protein